MDNKSVTDLAYLREIVMDDDSIVIETVETFLDDMPMALENIKKHHEAEDWEQLSKQAHKIKPNLKYMGMERAHEIILDIVSKQKQKKLRIT